MKHVGIFLSLVLLASPIGMAQDTAAAQPAAEQPVHQGFLAVVQSRRLAQDVLGARDVAIPHQLLRIALGEHPHPLGTHVRVKLQGQRRPLGRR